MGPFHVLLSRLIAGALLTGSPCCVGLAQAGQDPSASSAQAQIVVFDAPGGGSTTPVSVNAEGTITGSYYDNNFILHGFVRFANGHFDEFDAFGPCQPDTNCTVPTGINLFGLVTGSSNLTGAFDQTVGFIRRPDGNSVLVTVQGAEATRPTGINALGTVTGWAVFPPSFVTRGFVRAPDGSVTSFDAPGVNPGATLPTAINLFGSITGQVEDHVGEHGFVRDQSGNIIAFDPPGSGLTAPSSISLAGIVAGTYSTGNYHGFLRQPDGTFTEFDVPGSQSVSSAIISPTGLVAGAAVSGYQVHGYIRSRDGTFTLFDAPGARATFVSDINAFGVITGIYYDENFNPHAYLRVPASGWPFKTGG